MFLYTLNPIPVKEVSHLGFFVVIVILGLLALMIFSNSTNEKKVHFFQFLLFSIFVIFLSYFVSYKWTNQNPIVYPNEKVIGQFVGFVAEGYKEDYQSGKQRLSRDVHKLYVEYKVENSRVILSAKTQTDYPEKIFLYKNPK